MESLDFIEMMVEFAKNFPKAMITEIVVLDRTEISIQYNYGQRNYDCTNYNADLRSFSS